MFSEETARRHLDFIRLLRHTKSPWYGMRFQLLPWEEEILRVIYGTVDESCYREYRSLFLFIAKKNGKSELAAAMALDMLVNDDEYGAEIYSAASDREQAGIVFEVAASMVRQDPALEKRLDIKDSQKRIVYPKTGSFYRVLSSETKTKHGFNVHGLFFDELHAQPNRDLYDVLTEGSSAARRQPLHVFMTTAGFDKLSVCYEVYEYAKRVKEGVVEDKRFYPAIYEMGEKDDWHDERTWAKSNPSLGHVFQIDNLRDEYRQARAIPAKENSFRRLRLNQWTEQEVKWMNADTWKACKRKIDWEKLEGKPCYAGMDLASTTDLAAVLLVFEEEGMLYLKPFFWIPKDNIHDRVNKDRVPYDVWVRRGLINTTEGDVIDYDRIHVDINELRTIYRIQEMGFDTWNAQQLATQLDAEGLKLVPIQQTMKGMGPPTKAFEELVLRKQIAHDGNPVLTWMIANTSVREDGEGNYKPDKKKSSEKIDGVVAAIMAIDRLTRTAKKGSVYEKRGVRSL